MSVSASSQSSPSSAPVGPDGHSRSLLILGAGGHGCVVAELARACGYSRIDFADDRSPLAVGSLDELPSLALRYSAAAVSIGNLPLRRDLLDRLENLSMPIPALVHPSSTVSPSARIGPGVLVLPGAVVHTNAVVGKGAIVSAGAVVDHDADVGPCAHVDAGAVVAARAVVPALAHLPAGTCVRPSKPPKGPLP